MKIKEKAMMPEHEKMAKMSVLNDLKNSMSEDKMDKLHGLKKVSIMSNSPEGLEQGLSKAKELVEGQEEGSPEEMEGMEESQEMSSPEEMSLEQLDEAIKKLEMLKAMKMKPSPSSM